MIGLVVAGIAAVVFFASNRQPTIVTAPIELEGAEIVDGLLIEGSNSIQPISSPDTELGKEFPRISGVDFDGEEVIIENDGRRKAIYFLAHWCPNCQEEVPRVQRLIDTDQKPEELDIYSISTLVDTSRGNPQTWLESENWTVPVVLDDPTSSAFSYLGGTGTPYTVYVDENNRITNRVGGAATSDAQILQQWEQAVVATAPAVVDSHSGGATVTADELPTTDSDVSPEDSTDCETETTTGEAPAE